MKLNHQNSVPRLIVMWADAFSSFLFILFDSNVIRKNVWKCICSLIRHFNAASFTTSASCRGLPPAMTKLHLQWFRSSKDMSHTSAAIFFYSSVHSSVASWNEPSSSCIFIQPHGVLFKCICIHIQHFRASVSATSSVTSASSAALLKKAPQNKNDISNVSTTLFRMKVYTLQFQLYLVLKDYPTNVPTILFNIFGSWFNHHFNFHLCFNPSTCFSLKGALIVLFNISGTTSTSLGFSESFILFKCINFSYCYCFKSSRESKSEDIYNISTLKLYV